jgi:hypothetical protein
LSEKAAKIAAKARENRLPTSAVAKTAEAIHGLASRLQSAADAKPQQSRMIAPSRPFFGRTQSMEARLACAALVVAALMSCGAGARSQNFIVSAQTPQLAAEVCTAAENFRRDLAIEWLGAELPPWGQPCPISVKVSPQLGAGGKTSFVFHNGVPMQWSMEIFGSRERVLDSVLPHEVTHTIFATHFGRPLPRWADEGACTTVEHDSEREKQHRLLVQFLTSERGIPFNAMFAMKEYPADILPLYSQGYSLARWLIAQGGKPKFVQYVGEGMQRNDWTAATQKYYGYKNLSELQVTWLDWVKQGSPAQPATQVASVSQVQPAVATSDIPGSYTRNAKSDSVAATYARPAAPSNFTPASHPTVVSPQDTQSQAARPVSEGWYAGRRNRSPESDSQSPAPIQARPAAYSAPTTNAPNIAPGSSVPPAAFAAPSEPLEPILRAQSPDPNRQILLEWSRPANQPWSRTASQYMAGGSDTGTMYR